MIPSAQADILNTEKNSRTNGMMTNFRLFMTTAYLLIHSLQPFYILDAESREKVPHRLGQLPGSGRDAILLVMEAEAGCLVLHLVHARGDSGGR